MERLRLRLASAQRALEKLHEIACKEEINEIERDALIQRFEFSFELLWKCGKDYLRVMEGLDVASPKGVIRHCRELGIFDTMQTEQALRMADDRNLTTHVYDAVFAEEIARRIVGYEALLRYWYEMLAMRCFPNLRAR